MSPVREKGEGGRGREDYSIAVVFLFASCRGCQAI